MTTTLYEWSSGVVWRRNLYLTLTVLFAVSTVIFGGLFGGYYTAWRHTQETSEEYDRCLAETFAALKFGFGEPFDVDAEFHIYSGVVHRNAFSDPSKDITSSDECRRILADAFPKSQLHGVNSPDKEGPSEWLQEEYRRLCSDGLCASSKHKR